VRRLTVFLSVALVAFVALAGTAWAHVEIEPSSAPKGSDAVLTFVVPNEKEDATTVKVTVQFPTDHPIGDARVQSMPGWSSEVATTHVTTPIQTDEGEVDTAVKSVTWTATDNKGLAADQFGEFAVSVGLPDADSLTFPTVQTYSDGSSVNWVQETVPGGPEPDSPAPELTLTAGDDGHSTTPTTAASASSASSTVSQSDVDNAKTIAIIGVIVGALGLIAGVAAIVLSRRRSTSS
jgi:uncharacterized protein YcnI